MSDERRLTTDRFYGGTEHRLDLLVQFLSYVRSEHPSESAASEWLVQYTSAESQSATQRHIGFLSSIGFVAISNGQLSVGDFGAEWLERREPRVLFEALEDNVQGFAVILRSMMEGPQTDTDLMQALNMSGEFDMDGPGVAIRHREWLQVLGYVSRDGDENTLTADGQALATNLDLQQMQKSSDL